MEVPQADGLTEEGLSEAGLSEAEDDALRRLSYFADNAGLSQWSKSRLSDLRSRDRRDEVRLPRELSQDEEDGAA